MQTIGERLRFALEKEGRSQGDAERALGASAKGLVSRYATGKRGGSTVHVDKWKALARYLHVEFDWLVSGDGPMRHGGRDTSPAEEAIVLARRSGTPEATVQSAWERYKDRVATMTALDWAVAIHNEEQVLARPAVQKPEAMETTAHPARVDAKRKPPVRRPSGHQ